jgi:hypothetical protein
MSSTAQNIVTNNFGVKAIPYDVDFYVVRMTENIYFPCNSMIFINQGSTTAIVDQMTLAPGQFFSIPGELFEEMRHRFRVSFQGAGENNLVCVFKVYR